MTSLAMESKVPEDPEVIFVNPVSWFTDKVDLPFFEVFSSVEVIEEVAVQVHRHCLCKYI